MWPPCQRMTNVASLPEPLASRPIAQRTMPRYSWEVENLSDDTIYFVTPACFGRRTLDPTTPFADMVAATDSFSASKEIGRGAKSIVYRLDVDDKPFAVKRIFAKEVYWLGTG